MALRTSVDAVQKIIATKLTTEQITSFITDANLWVTEELASAGLSSERLELIERYLACALIRTRDVGLKSVTIGDVSEIYQMDLYISEYLQRAASFDPTGTVRQVFMKGGGTTGVRPVLFGVGTGFKDEAPVT